MLSAVWGYQITVRGLFGKKIKPREIKNKNFYKELSLVFIFLYHSEMTVQ